MNDVAIWEGEISCVLRYGGVTMGRQQIDESLISLNSKDCDSVGEDSEDDGTLLDPLVLPVCTGQREDGHEWHSARASEPCALSNGGRLAARVSVATSALLICPRSRR